MTQLVDRILPLAWKFDVFVTSETVLLYFEAMVSRNPSGFAGQNQEFPGTSAD